MSDFKITGTDAESGLTTELTIQALNHDHANTIAAQRGIANPSIQCMQDDVSELPSFLTSNNKSHKAKNYTVIRLFIYFLYFYTLLCAALGIASIYFSFTRPLSDLVFLLPTIIFSIASIVIVLIAVTILTMFRDLVINSHKTLSLLTERL
ncbi:hypothetical protein JD969_09865 [Planctomycetota bacterium]|nr:hypothetical protein JD969_09865 [Planctomycetota bacterium]